MGAPKKLRQLRGDHDFSLSDDFSRSQRVITQTAYFKAGDVVVAIGELNRPNTWNDAAFDKVCAFLQAAWNGAVRAAESPHNQSNPKVGE